MCQSSGMTSGFQYEARSANLSDSEYTEKGNCIEKGLASCPRKPTERSVYLDMGMDQTHAEGGGGRGAECRGFDQVRLFVRSGSLSSLAAGSSGTKALAFEFQFKSELESRL